MINEGQGRWATQEDMNERRLVVVVGKTETTWKQHDQKWQKWIFNMSPWQIKDE